MWCALWTLLLLYSVAAQPCTTQADMIAASYTACLTLPNCMDAFYLTPRHRVVEQVLFDILILRVLDNAAPLNYTIICANNESFSVWVYGTLQLQHFCKDNEVWDMKYKSCICRHDKLCIDEAAGTINYSNIIGAVVVAIALMTTLLFCSRLLTETKENSRQYKRVQKPPKTLDSLKGFNKH